MTTPQPTAASTVPDSTMVPAGTTTTTSTSTTIITTSTTSTTMVPDDRIDVILDTDANTELDDQHAIAYLLGSDDAFDVLGLTINRTSNGGALDRHVAEAARVVALMAADVAVIAGAHRAFEEIVADLGGTDLGGTDLGGTDLGGTDLGGTDFDGRLAVEFIVESVRASDADEVLVLPIGKLTNVALALWQAPDISDRVRILWLGSNYPAPGEYNQDNDESALQFLLDIDVPFEIALVRAGGTDGTASVLASISEIRDRMPGLGPTIPTPIPGREGGESTPGRSRSGSVSTATRSSRACSRRSATLRLGDDPAARATFGP